MSGNVISISQKLKKLGFDQKDILIISNQASFNYPANFPANTQRVEDDEPGRNILDENFELNLFYHDVNMKNHLKGFSGRYEELDPLSKRPNFEDYDNVFIYLTGHGGDLYMKVLYQEILFSRHFSDFFEEMFEGQKIKKAMVLSDTCSAATLFSTTKGDNVKAILFGSSEWDNFALSHGFDKYIGQPLKDKFTYHFNKLLKSLSLNKRKMNFKEFIQEFPKKKIESDLFFYNWMKQKKVNIQVTDFLIQEQSSIQQYDITDNIQNIRDLFE